MPRHTILLSIHCADGFTREVSLPGAGDLPHLADVFGLALSLLPAASVDGVPPAIATRDARTCAPTTRGPRTRSAPDRPSRRQRLRSLH